MKKLLLSILCCMLSFVGMQAEDASLSFDNKAQRTSFSTSEQVWEQNGIKLTNDKSNSTSNVADYAKPVRFYASSKITVNCSLGNITKIVFDCNSSSYATALKNSIGSSATATVSSDKVTVTLDGTSDTFIIAKLTAQVRMDALTVTYEPESEGGEGGGEEPETPVIQAPAEPTLPTSQEFEGDKFTVTITNNTEGATVYYTTDGTTAPTDKSTKYEGPFDITATTTIKAIAINEGGSSEVVSATYTKIEPVTPPAGDTEEAIFDASDQSYTNQETITNVTITDDIEAVFNKGSNNSNAPKYYTTGEAIRCYGGNYFTISAKEGITITKIELTFGENDASNEIRTDCGSYSNNTWQGVSNSVKFTIGGTSGNRRIQKIKVTYVVTGEVKETVATPAITPKSKKFNEGESLEITITTETEGAKIYYTTNGDDPTTESTLYSKPFTITEATTIKAFAVKDGWNDSQIAEEKYETTIAIEGGITDILNQELIGIKENQYTNWTNKTATSTAIYAGNSAGSNSSIQLRSDKNNSGIVTTTSGGKVKKVVVEWNTNTTDGRTLNVYGSNTVYTNATDLYDEAKQGKLLGTFKKGTSTATELIIEGDYKYIGIRSASGAMYLNSVEITWVKDETPAEIYHTLTVSSAGWSTLYLGYNTSIPNEVEAYYITTEGVQNGYVTLKQITNGILPANEGVIIKANAGDYKFYATSENATLDGNLLEGTLETIQINEAAYVLGIVDGEVGLYTATSTAQRSNTFINNANKAYLPKSALPAGASLSASFRFEIDGTTAIEDVETDNEVEVIYDLQGRRVNEITKAGIYIINGKKVFVK